MKKIIIVLAILFTIGCATAQPKQNESINLSEQEPVKAKQADTGLVNDIMTILGSAAWFIIH